MFGGGLCTWLKGRCCWLLLAAMSSWWVIGCAHEEATTEIACVASQPIFVETPNTELVTINGNQQWTLTGWEIQKGDAVTLLANGNVAVSSRVPSSTLQRVSFRKNKRTHVGPNGTFLYGNDVAKKTFPIPSAVNGPAPPFCLMGRIGSGKPFYVGSRKSWIATESGILSLGINDYDPEKNKGQFQVQLSRPQHIQPLQYEEAIQYDDESGVPREECAVVIFYIDGLRPDVVREMAYMGHIPTIRELFVTGGTWASNVFTAFPSDTITSNGTMWTGCFSDRHGIKGQVRFSRRTLYSESYLEPLGPNRSARLLAPQGIDKVVHNSVKASVQMTQGDDAAEKYDRINRTGVSPLFQHLRNNGTDWSTGVLPMMTDVPPSLWTRSMAREMPYLSSRNGWQYIDDINTHYTVRHLLPKRSPVTIVWLPETDSVSHKKNRGQFGVTRRTIAQADLLIKEVIDNLKETKQFRKTYFMLVSDHGHHGGRVKHLTHFDIANEFFFKPRKIDSKGKWIGGGLGMSVRQHRYWNRHPEHQSTNFVFIDGDSDGVARIFLPRGSFQSGRWMGKAAPADLLSYKIDKNRPPINLIDSLTATKSAHGSGRWMRPVDLVIAKLTDNSILISTADRGKAVIDRQKSKSGEWTYRYRVVTKLQPETDGTISFTEVDEPKKDPLRLTEHLSSRLFLYRHTEKEWLRMTAMTTYPDSVVAITRHMLWQENLKYREKEFAPDIVVTAHSGWYFGQRATPGTTHGYPLADAMRATLFVSGPNIRRGARMDNPCRLADLTPTILQMTGTPYNPKEFDGEAIQLVYQNDRPTVAPIAEAVYWKDVDLQAWQQLNYTPLQPYEHLPMTVNDPNSPFDLNNIAYNAITVSELNVLRLFDDVIAPVSGNRLPKMAQLAEDADQEARHRWNNWFGEAVKAIDLPGTSIGDYNWSSLGNLKRADRAVDWVQDRSKESDRRIANRIGRDHIPGSRHVHSSVDNTQGTIWELYRYAQRVVVQALDETILNGIENSTDRSINYFYQLPAEVPAD